MAAVPPNDKVASDPADGTRVVKIQRKNNVVVQDCDVYIGRACMRGGWNLPQSKWYNPFSVNAAGSAAKAVRKYESYILQQPQLLSSLEELRGKVLGCWCKVTASTPCHGDVLVRLLQQSPKCS